MLILTRKCNEAVRIGNIRIVVTRISGNQVRLGFETPPGCKAYREEIYESIENRNILARIRDTSAIMELAKDAETNDHDLLRAG